KARWPLGNALGLLTPHLIECDILPFVKRVVAETLAEYQRRVKAAHIEKTAREAFRAWAMQSPLFCVRYGRHVRDMRANGREPNSLQDFIASRRVPPHFFLAVTKPNGRCAQRQCRCLSAKALRVFASLSKRSTAIVR